MPPIRLSDDEFDVVMRAARPLAPHRRDSFLVEVANKLGGYKELGVGIVARVCKDLQRRHFDAPDLSHGDYSKHR